MTSEVWDYILLLYPKSKQQTVVLTHTCRPFESHVPWMLPASPSLRRLYSIHMINILPKVVGGGCLLLLLSSDDICSHVTVLFQTSFPTFLPGGGDQMAPNYPSLPRGATLARFPFPLSLPPSLYLSPSLPADTIYMETCHTNQITGGPAELRRRARQGRDDSDSQGTMVFYARFGQIRI